MNALESLFTTNQCIFDRKYKYGLQQGMRHHTMKAALTLMFARNGNIIVETGCQRLEDDWGAGCSTKVFAEVVKTFNALQDTTQARFFSIDNNPTSIKFATTLAGLDTEFICSDSVEALQKFDIPIDLLYLDSYDYPDGELVERHRIYMEKPTASYEAAMSSMRYLGDKAIVDMYKDLLTLCQQHQVNELEAASPVLHRKSIILLDDYDLPGGGKCRLSHEWLRDNMYEPILTAYQSLWIRARRRK